MKVFELAKELDMGAIELVEKLKSSGMSVRNHMVALSDDELEKARELFKAVEVAPAKKKVVKKKKVAKKKVVKKASASGDAKEDKKVTKKKKIVTVKRKSKKDLAEEKAAKKEEKAAEVLAAEAAQPQVETTAEKVEKYVEEKPKGLEVVYDPETKEEKEVEAKEETSEKKETKKVFKEKMHSFTPVYVPPEEEKKKSDDSPSSESSDSDDSKDGKSKKRIGNLASLVSKKGAAGKAQDLTMLRANEEMKLATSLVGQAVYIPARRKKVFQVQS